MFFVSDPENIEMTMFVLNFINVIISGFALLVYVLTIRMVRNSVAQCSNYRFDQTAVKLIIILYSVFIALQFMLVISEIARTFPKIRNNALIIVKGLSLIVYQVVSQVLLYMQIKSG